MTAIALAAFGASKLMPVARVHPVAAQAGLDLSIEDAVATELAKTLKSIFDRGLLANPDELKKALGATVVPPYGGHHVPRASQTPQMEAELARARQNHQVIRWTTRDIAAVDGAVLLWKKDASDFSDSPERINYRLYLPTHWVGRCLRIEPLVKAFADKNPQPGSRVDIPNQDTLNVVNWHFSGENGAASWLLELGALKPQNCVHDIGLTLSVKQR
ncbi:hypothetical protein [Ramlibacter alkalitolerans]|uniref:Uncharacterized protein n=1 Tax=Ramlibacter alkalitolerans TaxID=2039631 RepID=A0ABS1JYB9_9BURK|nr:hypothetical protein [Ramlibacter alkalitolerans]MBL0428731.1 hypothetical protein [Ramlibacter alkalitolerans]